MRLSFISLGLLPALAWSTPLRRASTIKWTPCEANQTEAIECGILPAPLDYTNNASNATVNLELRRIPAANSPARGSILFNFGGPGANGFASLEAYGAALSAATGGYHNLIVIAPRGTSKTLRFSCYATDEERAAAGVLYEPLAGNSSDTATGMNYATSEIFADTCYATQNRTGRFVSTSFTARDFMHVVDALNEDGLLRYWGFSYGTILGATLSYMFPDRMDRVVLDGVVNPHQYYSNREVELFADTDKVFEGFCSGCVATPENCTLAKNRTASELQEALEDFLVDLKFNPIILPVAGAPYILKYTTAITALFSNLYFPTTWPATATFIDNLMTGNLEEAGDYITQLLNTDAGMDDEAQFGIKCGDAFRTDTDREDIQSILEQRGETSKLFGDTADVVLMRCADWKLKPQERYTGDFKAKTKNPVLLIGNTHDPVTPLVSARNASAGLEGSVILEHSAYGHTTLAQGSICTAKAIRSYFLDGTLPEPDTKCEIETELFSGQGGWAEVIEELTKGGN
ncbi:TAP-like protein-domain-containing protein [Aspergillus avenaceus]|uniref:TAP-like protein-domain-containing protein n=1 Tax=Aspergillus avenaceus TaxID=36643 RepID=A0A5N6U0C9_ASPAV|nr:TAP-like protein-domain-containing protein [Aspergillus avenaceus]